MRRRRSCTASATATSRRWGRGSSGGRDFAAFDGPDAPGAAIVNETFARRYLANREPVGTTLTNLASGIGPLGVNLKWVSGQHGVPVEIVGVVADIRNVALGQDVEPAIYFTTRQFPFSEVVIAVRAADAGAGAAAVRNALRKVAPAVPMAEPRSWGSRLAERTAEARVLRSVLLRSAGWRRCWRRSASTACSRGRCRCARASWRFASRWGPRPAPSAGWWCATALSLVVAGLAGGLVAVQLLDGLLSRVLYGVSARDVVATGAACAVLIAAALVATMPPALRAMRVNPVDGLRAE